MSLHTTQTEQMSTVLTRRGKKSRILRVRIYARTADLSVSRLPADCVREQVILHHAPDAVEPALYAETVSIPLLSRLPPGEHLEDRRGKPEGCAADVMETGWKESVSAAVEPEY